jgi:hypothetical protein
MGGRDGFFHERAPDAAIGAGHEYYFVCDFHTALILKQVTVDKSL